MEGGGVACSRLQLGCMEKTVIASLIALWFVLRQPFFVEKIMLHVLLVVGGYVIFLQKNEFFFMVPN